MSRRDELNTCMSVVMLKFLLVVVFLPVALSSFVPDDSSQQNLFPINPMDPSDFWVFVSDTKPPGGVFLYSRLGRKFWRLPQTLIPYPRAGRELTDEEYELLEDLLGGGEEDPLDQDTEKRRHIAFKPRIGRRKRSIPDSEFQKRSEKEVQKRSVEDKEQKDQQNSWEDDLEEKVNLFARPDRSRSRISFVPRVGKKSSDMEAEIKRALALTPRIGRASLIPRIGRNDQRFKVKSRGAFIPRIGRRAALIPRIGRSQEKK